MKNTRRGFLAMAGGSLLGAIPLAGRAFASAGDEPEAEESCEANQWAMVIDTRKCLAADDCKDCMAACHKVHNVPEIENPAHEVKWIWKAAYHNAFPEQQHPRLKPDLLNREVMVMCNHCDDAPCVSVCPTGASHYGPGSTVQVNADKCTGCKACITACPYNKLDTWIHDLAKLLTGVPVGRDIARQLDDAGIRASAIHGDKSQGARTRALENFKKGNIRALVATDIAARGIDVDGITHVIVLSGDLEILELLAERMRDKEIAARLKRFRAVADIYRNHGGPWADKFILIAAGLSNYHLRLA